MSHFDCLAYICEALVFGCMCTAVWESVSLASSKRRERHGLRPPAVPRTTEEIARAFAFEDMYPECRHEGLAHYLTETDKEDVRAAVIQEMIRKRGDQGLLYQQAGISYGDYLDRLASSAVEQAALLFLQI